MGQLRLNLLVIVLVVLTPISVYGGAKESPQPSEGICYKVIFKANFNELIKHYNIDYAGKISDCTANTYIPKEVNDESTVHNT